MMASRALSAWGNWKVSRLVDYIRPCACGTLIVADDTGKRVRQYSNFCSTFKHIKRQHPLWKAALGQLYSLMSRRYVAQHKTQDYDPYRLVQEDITALSKEIQKELMLGSGSLQEATRYHFDGAGKAFRPMVVLLMARACNIHTGTIGSVLLPGQQAIAMIAEMLHTASLVHDDVIDAANTRRGKLSTHRIWGPRKAILAGDYILATASMALARIRNEEVICILSQVLEDLVRGEFMQLGSKEDKDERFNHYMKKTFKKTASLIANSCKAVAVLGNSADGIRDRAYEYGRNIGIAFQLVDDLLDFVSSETMMGKPTTADLRLGLATAPVLFAAEEHPELNPMIMRRFSEPGDVEEARELVAQSSGVSHTRYLAEQHCKEAIRQIEELQPSIERDALVTVTHKVLNRLK